MRKEKKINTRNESLHDEKRILSLDTWEPRPFRLDLVGERAGKLAQIRVADCIPIGYNCPLALR
jgi:hypothetical protein